MTRLENKVREYLRPLLCVFITATGLTFFAGYEVGLSMRDKDEVVVPTGASDGQETPPTITVIPFKGTKPVAPKSDGDTRICTLQSLQWHWRQRCIQQDNV